MALNWRWLGMVGLESGEETGRSKIYSGAGYATGNLSALYTDISPVHYYILCHSAHLLRPKISITAQIYVSRL